MATRGVIVGATVLLAVLTLAAGCTLRTGDGSSVATGTPPVAATPASTGAGGAEETPSPVATTVQTTTSRDHERDHRNPDGDADTDPNARRDRDADPGRDRRRPWRRRSRRPRCLLPYRPVTSTIAELASADPELSRFVQALRQGGIYETLNGTGTYTVFAPDNAAFDAVPPGTLTRLLFDRDALAAVADYHVIYGRWLSADLARESSVATRSGVPLTVTRLPDGRLQVDDGAHVTRADIVATNGVLHVVDRVMIPPGAL